MSKIVDVIIRKTSEKATVRGEGSLSLSVSAPSVIQVHASAQDVVKYERIGKDLLIYMKDGSVIRCSNYFQEALNEDEREHSELVFIDGQELTHVSFANIGDLNSAVAMELTPVATPIESIEPFLGTDSPDWMPVLGAILAGGALGALLASNSHSSKTKTEVIDNTKEVESTKPTFIVSDTQGDKQGVLVDKAVTDDTTPTFSGTGQAGATIQIKDASGNTIASTMVGSNGKWSVKLPAQTDGTHKWSVVQIDGSKTVSAGDITLTVNTKEADITVETTASDDVINAAEQAAGFTLSGSTTNLASGTELTVKLNGKTYTAKVGADGKWSVDVPPADAKALADGNWTVTVTGTDATGNTVTTTQGLGVDTKAPTLSVDSLTADNVVNAAEHGGSLQLTGKSDAEPGQTVTVVLDGKTYTGKVGKDGTWSVTLDAKGVAALQEGHHDAKVSVSDLAGNVTNITAGFTVDTAAPVVTVDIIAGDNILNAAEQNEVQIISGRAVGAAEDDIVVVKIGNYTVSGLVQADGTWSVGVPPSEFAKLPTGSDVAVSVTVTDKAGNVGHGGSTIQLIGEAPKFTVDTISGDNVLNATEATQPLTLSGTTNLPNGSKAVVTLNGKEYNATIANGKWTAQVPTADVVNLANTTYTVTISGSDVTGNPGSASGTVLVDTVLPTVIINTFAGDNKVNLSELGQDLLLSGRVNGAAAGDTVSITIGNKSFSAKVGSDLSWKVTVPANGLTDLGDGSLPIKASVTNAHGNTGEGQRDISINAQLPGLRINTVSGDDVINAIEQNQDLTITGNSEHLAVNTPITVTINGVTYPAIVGEGGKWQIGVPASDLKNWPEGEVAIKASAQDDHSNPVEIVHSVELDLNEVAITIDKVSGDDIISAAEKGESLLITGMTQGVEAGQTVVVKFAGLVKTAEVQADGSWSLTLQPSEMDSLIEGRADISVSVTNIHGNSAEGARTVIVDTLAPTLAIDSITDDNIINATEAGQALTITGTSNAEAGQQVQVTVNGKTYTGTVQADGTWSVDIQASDMSALKDGNLTVKASVSDVAGNSTDSTRVALVDASVPVITINTFAADDIINAIEHDQAQILSGTSTGGAAGDLVTITAGDKSWTTVLDANGNWSLGLSASEIKAFAQDNHTFTVSITDSAGNTGKATHDFTVSLTAPDIAIDTIAADDVVNALEKGADLEISGTSNQPSGTEIIVTLNGVNYVAKTDADGSWSVIVPAANVSALGEAGYTVTASVTDTTGNSNSAEHTFVVDSALPTVTINLLAGDDIINKAELEAGQTLTGNVTNAAAGDTVTITIGGKSYEALVQADLSWSLPLTTDMLTALGDGPLPITASVTNGVGNTGTGSRDVAIDADIPGIRVDTVAGDDVINSIEHNQNLIITGTSDGLKAGSFVTVTINGVPHQATVQADGSWQASVQATEVSGWEGGPLNITVSGESSAGNPVEISHQVTVDLSDVAVSINSITDDNVLNAAEKGQPLELSGQTSNVEAGQTVTITFAGKTYTATVEADGSWSHTVPAADLANLKDGDASVQVSVTNVNGNSASASHEYSVDATKPTLSIDTVAGDNILNAAEAGQTLTLTGSSNAEAGQTVTLTLNGKTYTGTVQADGSWSVDVASDALTALADGTATITATVSDKAGNSSDAATSILVDQTTPVISIDPVTADNILNASEHGQALIISGSVTGAEAGDKIVITLNGKTYNGVVDAGGNWSVPVKAADVSALAEQGYTLEATLTDKAGNTGEASHSFTVNLTEPEIAINTIAGDDVVNALEKGADLEITGTSNQPADTGVTVVLNGKTYTTQTKADGSWSVSVSAADVAALGEAGYTVTASVTDVTNNSNSAEHTFVVDSALPTVTINLLAGDDIINKAEVEAGQTLTGSVTNAAAGDIVTILIGGKAYEAEVQADLSWSLPLTTDMLTALGDGPLPITASVTNGVGNTGTGSRDVAIDANIPGIRVDTVAGDDIINSIEHNQNLIITGTSDGLKAGSFVTVTINGVPHQATVQADGSWQASVQATEVSGWADGPLNITVSGESSAGNPVEISHQVTVDLSDVAVSINSITDDNVLNAAEKGQPLELSGQTSNVEAGQTVTITFAGKTYTATVEADGSWSHTVPAADLTNLKDGDASVQVSVTNVNGNSASASHEYSVDATKPTLSIDTVAGDNILNAAEAGQTLTLTGTSNAEAGQTVTLTLNGKTYTGTVQADGSWSVDVASDALAALADGTATISATVSDKAGNSSDAATSILVDQTTPVISIDPVTADNILNASEHGQALIISGSVTGAEAGDKIVITLNGKTYNGVVDAGGNWSVPVKAADVSALAEQGYTLEATLTDKAGNTGEATHDFTVNLTEPTLTIDVIAGDDVLNSDEKTQPLTISGTAVGLDENTNVTVTLNGKNYFGNVTADGTWSVSVPANDLAGLGEAFYQVSVSATDATGNTGNAERTLGADSLLPGVIIDPVTNDNIINAAELEAGQTLTGRVTNAAEGDTVTIMIGGKSYQAQVQSDLTWSLPLGKDLLSALGNGPLPITASVTNGNGNTGTGSRDVVIDADIPGIRVDTVSGDDVINSIEHNQNLVITGTSDGLKAGSFVTVTINGVPHQATVQADGSWQASVQATEVSGWADGPLNITVSGESSAGNPVEISHQATVDLSDVAVSINSITDDNVLNAAEKGQPLELSGQTSNVEAGQTVTITFAGKTYTATVEADGSWSHTVPAADLTNLKDGDASVQVSVTNVNGNSASASHEYSVDATKPTLSIDTVAGDNILNAAEAGQTLTLTGSSNAEAGQTVTLTLNGKTYTGTVQADGSWSVDVASDALAALADGTATITATVSDKAGNSADTSHTVLVDTTVPVVTIDTIAGDDIINLTEHTQSQIISGSVTGAEVGDQVMVTIGTYTTKVVVGADGKWSAGIPAGVISALQDGDVPVSVTVTDKAGNVGTQEHTVVVDTGLPSLSFDAISDDNVLNAVEKGETLTLSGTSANLAEGTVVTVTLNNKAYTATVDADGKWSTTVQPADLAALGEANYTLTAQATNGVGNTVAAKADLLVNTALPVVTINQLAGDDIINKAELEAGQTLTGSVTNAAAGDTVTITIGGKSYEALVQADLSWSLPLTTDILTALGDGPLPITASVTNGVGNTGTGSRDVVIDADIPGIRVDTVSGDDVINSIEHNQNLVITGTSDGLKVGSFVTVTINGVPHQATVQADGSWQASVQATEVSGWADGPLNITVSGESSAGNPVEISHQVTVDLSDVAVSINSITDDNVLNAAEKGQPLELSGQTSNVEAGQTVTITFAGKTYTATVEADGSWSHTVPAADLANLKDGDASVQVSVTNVNGNSASASHDYSVDATKPTLSIDTVAGDNILNAAEAGQTLTLTGSSNAEAGQTVTLTLNGKTYTGTVQADGSWSVDVASDALAALADGTATITATVSDKAGNSADTSHTVLVDTTVPVVTIDTVAGDDIINLTEHTQAQIISGSVTGAEVGDQVMVTIGTYTTRVVVGADGKWSAGIPAGVISALQDGDVPVSVTVTDKAGNVGTQEHTVVVDTGLPSLSFDAISDDNVLNAVEKGETLTLSGTSANLAEGTVVTVTLNNKAYTATVDADGKWSTTVQPADLAALGEANYTLTAQATNGVGNTVAAKADLLVNTALPVVTINQLAGDDIINKAELEAGQTLTGSVTNAAAGDTVTITIGGKSYEALVQADLSWSLPLTTDMLTALGDGPLPITASVTNGVGNTGTGSRDVVIDADIPGIRVDTVSGDDVINSIEHNQNLIITGTSDGLKAGSFVTVTINGVPHQATVQADGSWQASVQATEVSGWADGPLNITVSGESSAGNPVEISHQVTVDLSDVAVSINSITDDNVLNAAEKGQPLELSGQTSNVEAGQTVTITFAGKTYTATVEADGSWSHTVPAADLANLKDGDASVQVSVTNVNGNSASASHEYSVDATKPTLSIDTVAGDNILNAAEAGQTLTLTGSSNAEAGQTVTLTLNGKTYTGTVQADGSWSVDVASDALAALADGTATITATVSDKAGNSADTSHTVLVDTTVPVVTIDTVAGDDIINLTEHTQAQIISGSVTGAEVGDQVMVTIGTYTTRVVVGADGKWSAGIPAGVISALQDGDVPVSVTVTDKAGNVGTQEHTVVVDTGLPSLSFDAISDDNVLNAVEKGETLTLSGTSANLAEGTVVTVTLNNKAYTATVDADGKWSTTVQPADLAALGEANYTLTAQATNGVGNTVAAKADLLVNTALPVVTINQLAGDDIINKAELEAGQTLTGSVTNAAAGDTVTITIGGKSYEALVQADLSWSLPLTTDILTALGDGPLPITASVTNGVGNTGTGSRDVVIDADIPGIRVDTVSGDDVINSIEHNQNLVITGTSDGLKVGSFVTVTINGVPHQATVQADGSWQASVQATEVSGWADGPLNITVSGESSAGNPVEISHQVTVDLSDVAVSINSITDDNVLNAAEKGQPLELSGQTSNVEAGQTVTITFAGKTYTATVEADGSWSHTVPAADLTNLKDGDASVQVSVTNVNGNSASASHEYSVDATKPTLSIDTVAGDNILNAAEAGQTLTLTGSSNAEAGQTVTLTLNGKTYTGTVQADGSWSVDVASDALAELANGNIVVSAEVTDKAGNPGSTSQNLLVDTIAPAITINTVAGDDIINMVEHSQAQIISGKAAGAEVGDQVVVTINNVKYPTTVDAAGNWSIGMTSEQVTALENGPVVISVTVTDKAGNVGQAEHTVTVNTAAVSLTVDTVSGDNVINATEHGEALVISGNSSALAENTKVTLTLNGETYEAFIKGDGSWSVTIPADKVAQLNDDTQYKIEVSAQDDAANTATASRDINVDISAPLLTISPVSIDNILNAAEQQQTLVIQGTSSAEAGQQVTVKLGNGTYTAQVGADGRWSVQIAPKDLALLQDGNYVVSASVSDKAGNQTDETGSLRVDTVKPTITFDTVAGDDIINALEQQAGVTISGTTSAEPGQTVVVTFNGRAYEAKVQEGGTWSVNVKAADFNGVVDNVYTISASVKDIAGNQGDASHDVTLSGEVPTISINTFAGDDIVNALEHGTPLLISGTTTAPAGKEVTVTLNGQTYYAKVQADGTWSTSVGSGDVSALLDGKSYTITAQVTNSIGNPANAEHTVNVDISAPSMGISIDSLQNDTGLSATDFITNDANIVVKGSLTAALGGDEKAQISLDGGNTWIDLVVTGTTWTYADGRTLQDGTWNYQVRVIDKAGNVGATDSQDVVLDTKVPEVATITVDNISRDTGLASDDFITSDNTLTLNGSLGAELKAGEYVQISIDGGKSWIDVDVSGTNWTYVDTRTLKDGDYNYQLRVIDDAGNVSATTNKVVTVDTVAPTPTLTVDSISDDTGIDNRDFITRDTTLTIHGSLTTALTEGEFVQISLDGGNSWQNVTMVGASWYFVDGRTLEEGDHDYWLRVVDTAGNVGNTIKQTVTVDLTPPDDSLTVSIDSISDDTGYSNTDFLTNDTSLTIHGSLGRPLGEGEYVQISVDNGINWVYVSVVGDEWSYEDTRVLKDGENTYQVRVIDKAGNVGQTAEQVVVIDTTPPTNIATIVSYTDDVGSDRGVFGSGTVTDDRTPTLNGTLSAALTTGELVRIYRADGTYLGEAKVDGTNWSYELDAPLIDGDVVHVYAVVVDAAGNEGKPSVDFNFTVNLEMFISTQDTLDNTPIIKGRVDFEILEGEYVEVTVNGRVYSSRDGQVVIDPNNSTWYVQIPDEDALNLNKYDVSAVLYGKDGSVITKDVTNNELTVSAAPEINFTSTAASTNDTSTALTLSEDGTWRILSNSTVFTQNGTSSSTLGSFGQTVIKGIDTQQQSSFIDFDRDGLMDIMGADTGYANGQQSFKYNADGTYTSFQVGAMGVAGQTNDPNGNTYVWYGGFMGIDIDGDGFVDVVYGDQTPNDAEAQGGYDTTFVMNTDGTITGFDKSGAYVYTQTNQDGVPAKNSGNPTPDREVSGVDLNNDGFVDIMYHGTDGTNRTSGGGSSSSNTRMVVVTNGVDANGNVTLTNTQVVTGVFYGDTGTNNWYTTMTWADLNGDGYMDLFIGGYGGQGGTYGAASAIYYNDGQGNLTAAANGVGAGANVQKFTDTINSSASLAVDWNGDGKMDLIEVAGIMGSTVATNASNIGALWINGGTGSNGQVNWTQQTLLTGANQGNSNFVTGALSLDLDYDGDKDLVVFRASGGKTTYVENKSVIQDGTSIILRISDANGINSFYGNTVLLVDESTGKVVSSQVINAQGGVNMNDSTGLVYFYGLDASKSYSAMLLTNNGGYGGLNSATFDSGLVRDISNVNASWAGLKAVEKNHAYVLTAEKGESAMDSSTAATDATNTTGIVGTGYNDTLYATAGTHVYNGGGGSTVVSDTNVWVSEGGMDIVDYKLAGDTALTIDLGKTGAQNTGFGTATFVNIEGIAGGSGNDVFTGNSGDNIFEGRGGDDTFNIGKGGQDTLLYKLLNASDATGGNGSDVVNGFSVGTWEGTADSDRIDLRELLADTGYTGSGSATYINGVATLDKDIGNLSDYISVVQNGSSTEIRIDRDGNGGNFDSTTVVTLNGVQTDLATLLANHQLLIV